MIKDNLTNKQKADLYPDFYKAFKTGAPKGISSLTSLELAVKWDELMKEFKETKLTHPGRERLRRLGWTIEEPINESKRIDREVAEV
jgi:hypothetical protein